MLKIAAPVLVFALLAACSSGVGTPVPTGDGTLAGGRTASGNGNTPPTSMPTSTAPSPPSEPAPTPAPGGSVDAGGGADAGSSTTQDSGFGYFIDTGPGAPTPTGGLGSCTNPACGSDGNECGCQATDSSGNQVQIGCQAAGQCVCVLNGNVDTDPFDENGACGTSQATAAQFLHYCMCQ